MNRRELMRNAALAGVTVSLPRMSAAAVQDKFRRDPKPLEPDPTRLYATAKHAMVSTSHPLATEAAVEALKKGGNAVDAYLMAAIAQTVVEPVLTTLAGVLDISYYETKSGEVFRSGGGFANPKNENDVFRPHDYSTGRTVMVPGYVAGIHAASKRWGKLSWRELFEPAIYYAKNGFVIDHLLWGLVFEYSRWIGRFPEGREIWYPNGHLLGVGDVLKQPRLAATLERLVEEGPDYFYRGAWAKKFVQMVQAQGSKITLEDMTSLQASINASVGAWARASRAPEKGAYREYEVVAPSNPMMILALKLVEEGGLRSRGRPTQSADTLYYLLRIVQEVWHTGLSYGPESYETLLSKDYAKQLWKLIEGGPPRPYEGINAGTCAVVVVDPQGNIACGTHSSSSIPYGTGIIVDGVGVNRVVYHRTVKVPRGVATSHMIFQGGKPVMAIGSPSRSFFTNIFQNTVNVLEYGMNLWESVNQPLFGAADAGYEDIENRFPEELFQAVEKRGLQLMRVAPGYIHMGSCQAIMIDRAKGEIHGVADPRRLGAAQGY